MSSSFAKRDLAIAIPMDDTDNDANPYWQTPQAEEEPVELPVSQSPMMTPVEANGPSLHEQSK